MNKLILLLILVGVPQFSWGVCSNKIDPKKVMLFVDTNTSDLEIATAEKAACQRGERFEVVPKNYKAYTTYIKAIEIGRKALHACVEKYKDYKAPECESQRNALNVSRQKQEEFINKQVPLKTQINEEMKALSAEKVKLTSVSISGHDGGGHFGGEKGSFSRSSMQYLMSEYPELNEVESVLLLGCYTGVQKEVSAWKSIFPKIRVIGGYDGSAPLAERPQGHQYIRDILTKEKSLKKISTPKSLNAMAKALLGDLDQLNAAIYLRPSCNEEEGNEFYYASKIDRNFTKFDVEKCEKAMADIKNISPLFREYMDGTKEPPTDTANGELRTIYNLVRTNEHCLKGSGMFHGDINGNAALNLLFWHGFKNSFANYYKDDLAEAEKILASIDAKEVMQDLEKAIAQDEETVKEIEETLKELERDPEGLKARYKKELVEANQELERVKALPEIAAVLKKANDFNYRPTKEETAMMSKFYKAQNDLFTADLRARQSIAETKDMLQSTLQMNNSSLSLKRNSLEKLKADPNVLKNVFIPNKENLSKKTRKEVLENIHQIHGLMSSLQLKPKQQAALVWLSNVSSTHFQYFQNPFEWHEANERPVAPPQQQKLSDFLQMYENAGQGYGYGGGFGATFSSSGTQSGSGGGW